MMKKILALVLAVMMVTAMITVAFAAGANTDDDWNDYNGVESNANTLNIAKAIIFKNAEATNVREPNIVYTYTISSAAVDANTKITGLDKESPANEWTVPVKAGPLAAVTGAATATTSTITFADTNRFGATSDGAANKKTAAFTFDPSKFLVNNALTPGIYRYAIAETTSVEKSTVGINAAGTYNADRYLDVYVHWKDAAHTILEIYGYVLFEGTATTSIDHSKTADLAKKSEGYVNASSSSGTMEDVDVYITENLVISKVTTGSLADKNHDFPVTITFTKATGLSDGIKLDYAVTGNGTLTKVAADSVGDYVVLNTVMAGTVRDSSTITITGIPNGSSVVMNETNDTVDFYRVKVGTTAGAADLLAEAVVNSSATSGNTSSVSITDSKKEIHFTNTLSEISPTGIVLRVAPYALMLAAGIILLLISRKRKNQAEEA